MDKVIVQWATKANANVCTKWNVFVIKKERGQNMCAFAVHRKSCEPKQLSERQFKIQTIYIKYI